MTSILDEIVQNIEQFLDRQDTLTKKKFQIKKDSERGLSTATINLFSDSVSCSGNLFYAYRDLKSKIRQILLGLDNKQNEIISYVSHGVIYDQGKPFFRILQGQVYDIYLYQTEGHIILRLTHEKALPYDVEFKNVLQRTNNNNNIK
ncbi:MAG: hypothetical protein ACTSVM_06155, partial [Candidatus Ranarchaeia archaeon]